ncbi:MAG TPA: MATE family efflux transporter [Ohtaekwangia sp.]|nr:MATE family efflux transporter [Ohtaekwangia sp.]
MALLTLRAHLKENTRLAIPVMLSNLGHVMMGVCDNIMVGHIDTVSLAGSGLAIVAFNVLLLFGIGVSYAITPLVAAAHGENNESHITKILRHGLVINTINGIFLVGVVYFARHVLYYINQPPEVVDKAIPYLNIIMLSLIPVLIFQSFKQFAEGLSNTRIALVVVIISNLMNILLNYLLIYGHAGFPELGLNGAGWATLISRIGMAIGIALYFYYAAAFRQFRGAFKPIAFSKKLFVALLALGIPSGAQFIFEVAAFDFSLVMMGWLGTETQAAHQIVINMATLSYMTTAGVAAAATIRVGYFSGKGDAENLSRSAYTSVGMALALMSLWAILFIAGNSWLPTLYVEDNKVIAIASSLLIIAGLFQLSDGVQVVCNSALRGLQDVKIPSLLIFISYWIIGLPLGYWLAFILDLGAIGIWTGLLIGLTLTATATFLRLRSKLLQR